MSALKKKAKVRAVGCLLLGALACVFAPKAWAQSAAACVYRHGVRACAPYACVPTDPADLAQSVQTMIPPDAPGQCGQCRFSTDPEKAPLGRADCGGSACAPNGTCALYDKTPPPRDIWPRYHLLVVDVSVTTNHGWSAVGPIIGAGYLFQGALSKTHPTFEPAKGYLTTDLPHLYFDAGGSMSFSAQSQNLFANLGLTFYSPALPFGLTTLSAEGIYQRVGAALWKEAASDRFGGGLQLGFLQNVFLRGAYVHTVHGTYFEHSWLFSIIYMKDLLGDVIPDRFQKYVPKGL